MADLAYGFIDLEHLLNNRLADSSVQEIEEAIRVSVEEHNRQVGEALSEMVEVTTEYKRRFKGGFSGTLQPIDDMGNPLPVRGGSSYDVAFPIKGGGTAWGNNRISRAKMTVNDVNRNTLGALRLDADWMKRHMLGALLDNTSWTYSDEDHGDLVIQPLANGDSVEFVRKNGSSSADNHYLAQSAGIADATNPFPNIFTELSEHPENEGAEIVCYIPSNVKADVEALTDFVEVSDPNVQAGSSTSV